MKLQLKSCNYLPLIKANEKDEENSNSLIPINKKTELQHSKLFHEEQKVGRGNIYEVCLENSYVKYLENLLCYLDVT